MLVISRKVEQGLRVGDSVIVRVLEISGDTVKIGIQAPPEVRVHREEVYRRIQAANEQAAISCLPDPGVVRALKKS